MSKKYVATLVNGGNYTYQKKIYLNEVPQIVDAETAKVLAQASDRILVMKTDGTKESHQRSKFEIVDPGDKNPAAVVELLLAARKEKLRQERLAQERKYMGLEPEEEEKLLRIGARQEMTQVFSFTDVEDVLVGAESLGVVKDQNELLADKVAPKAPKEDDDKVETAQTVEDVTEQKNDDEPKKAGRPRGQK